VETYFRLFIPYIFPNISKVLYFDGDMVCLTDICRLFDFDISNYLIGAARDNNVAWYFLPRKYKTNRQKKIREYFLSFENPNDYICAGMLLINCEKFRDTYSQKDVIDATFSRKWQDHDQDVINFLAKGKILYLDYGWNYIPTSNFWEKYLPPNIKDEFIAAKENPKIIHYKPYIHWFYVPYFNHFWKYATRTPFINEIVNRMNEKGFVGKGLKDRVLIAIQNRINSIVKAIFARKKLCKRS
jgi:lipopolysaccharide biosynthesis glycosyltransferase